MARNYGVVLCLFLVMAASAVHSTADGMPGRDHIPAGRGLLQREPETVEETPEPTEKPEATDEGEEDEEIKELTPEEQEAERERAALEAFELAQERKANETRAIIEIALPRAEEAVEAYSAANTGAERVAVFVELFQNANGVAAKFALNTLNERGLRGGRFVRNNVQQAIGIAIDEGFSENVARAISFAFTVQRTPRDQETLLDVLVSRKNRLNRRRSGSGCEFIKNLFTDADVFANRRGDSNAFVAAFDSEEYLPLMECFLDECTGQAARCCTHRRALRTGLCGCPTRRSKRCDFNLFANNPRTIWVCSRRGCSATQKCLCPAPTTS